MSQLDQPVLQLLYALLNTPGFGGLFVGVIIVTCLVTFAAALRWIARGGAADEDPIYAHPTTALHNPERKEV